MIQEVGRENPILSANEPVPSDADFYYYQGSELRPGYITKDESTNYADPEYQYTVGLEPTPIDEEVSMLPLSILPNGASEVTSEHHLAHPKDHPLLRGLGGIVVRTVRLQTVAGEGGTAKKAWWGGIPRKYDLHPRYHYFFKGPELPKTEKEQFEYAVWATSGYIPEQAIDLSGRKPRVVVPTLEQTAQIRSDIRNVSYGLLHQFLKNYVFKQDLGHVDERFIDEFVSTRNWARKRFLGRWLLAQASQVASEDMSEAYRIAHKRGQIMPVVSAKVSNVVQVNFLNKKREQKIIDQFQQKLLAA